MILRGEDIREYLFLAMKYMLIVFAVFHLFATILAWRQVLVMHNQVKTRTGNLLVIINLLNILVVFIVLLIVIFLMSSKLS